jgi:hypothetical protein
LAKLRIPACLSRAGDKPSVASFAARAASTTTGLFWRPCAVTAVKSRAWRNLSPPGRGGIYCSENDIRLSFSSPEVWWFVPVNRKGFGRGQTIYDPWHYVPVLARKPGALRNGAPFKNWVLPASLDHVRRRLRGSDDGDRALPHEECYRTNDRQDCGRDTESDRCRQWRDGSA